MIEGGYILQPRVIDDSETAQFPPVTRELWHYLLRKVNHARNDRLNINRGQGFFRFSEIQEGLKWYSGYRKNVYSKPQLTKSLRRLREGNMVETTKETRGLLITICNYDYYQDPKNYEGNDEETAKGSRKKSKGRTINKNVKNEKNDNKDLERFNARVFLSERKVKSQHISEWLKIRGKKKLQPTLTAFKAVEREAGKAKITLPEAIEKCCEESWGGFKAEWLKNGDSRSQSSKADQIQIEKEKRAMGINN